MFYAFWRWCSSCWLTRDGLLWTCSLFMHSLCCIIFPSPVVFMLAAIKKDFFYNLYHDWCPSGSCFHAGIPADCFTPRAHRAAKHCGPQSKILSVALSCPFSRNLCSKAWQKCAEVYETTEMLFSRTDTICRPAPVAISPKTNSIELLVLHLFTLCHKRQ